jgi:hypothetical protein
MFEAGLVDARLENSCGRIPAPNAQRLHPVHANFRIVFGFASTTLPYVSYLARLYQPLPLTNRKVLIDSTSVQTVSSHDMSTKHEYLHCQLSSTTELGSSLVSILNASVSLKIASRNYSFTRR